MIKKNPCLSVRALCLAAIVVAAPSVQADTAPIPMNLGGSTSFDAWSAPTGANNPGYGSFPGSGAWPAPIGSDVAGSGDATLSKLSNANGGGAYPAGESIYFGGFSGDPNTQSSMLSFGDLTPLSNLKNVVFQMEIGQSSGFDFYNNVLPVLNYNGGSQHLVASFSSLLAQDNLGLIDTPTGPAPLFRDLWGLQWDLSSITGPITSFEVTFTGVQHAQLYRSQIDQSSVFTQAVPEPSTYAMIIAGVTLLLAKTRRRLLRPCAEA